MRTIEGLTSADYLRHVAARKNVTNAQAVALRGVADEMGYMDTGIAALKAALADLHAAQNGPPLIRDEAIWQAAMDKAERLLGLAAQRREGE